MTTQIQSSASPSSATTTSTDRAERRVGNVLPERTVGGILLIVIGLVIVASRLVPDFGQYALLMVGISCFVAFLLTREYGLAVAAGITGGLGVGIVASAAATDPTDGVIFMGSFAAGFLAVWILGLFAAPRETNPWPLVPAAVFGAVALTIHTESSMYIDWLIGIIAVVLVAAGLRAFVAGRGDRT